MTHLIESPQSEREEEIENYVAPIAKEGRMNVLIADDSGVSRRLLESSIKKWGYESVTATDGKQAWEMLQSNDAPRLVVLDWMMPGFTGPEVCRMLRAKNAEPYTYVLLLTSRDQKEDLIEGMESGADDYLSKPFNQQELKVRLRAGRRIVELQYELLRAREALRVQATIDSLTGLKNRGMIFERLCAEMERSKREHTPCGILILDIDHFKVVNDTEGHAAGDTVLRQLALRFRENIRPYDAAGRYGGEEFLILLPGCDLSNTVKQAERLRRLIADKPIHHNGKAFQVTASFGATCYAPSMTAEQLVQIADEALYRAKNCGRNRVEYQDAAATIQKVIIQTAF